MHTHACTNTHACTHTHTHAHTQPDPYGGIPGQQQLLAETKYTQVGVGISLSVLWSHSELLRRAGESGSHTLQLTRTY